MRQHSLHQMLSLGPRNQNGRRDAEGKPVELLLPGDVLDRLMPQAALDGIFIAVPFSLNKRPARIGKQLSAADAECVQQQKLSIAARRGREMRIAGQTCGSFGNGFAERHTLMLSLLDADNVAIGVEHIDRTVDLREGDVLLVQEMFAAREALGLERDAGAVAERRRRHKLHLLA